MIYHITTLQEWGAQKNGKTFQASSLVTEGFIHACSRDQISGVIERYFNSKNDLVVLEIDEGKLNGEIRYEPGPTGELFPHIYGPIEMEAVTTVQSLK